jgi:predicted dehydrogenase
VSLPGMRPRLAFVGLGWIGESRLRALAETGAIEVAALCDPDATRLGAISSRYETAASFRSLEELLSESQALALDGAIIATPNAFHASQTIECLDAGLAVLCQKPLSLTRTDAERVVASARRADRLLGVDFTYRHTASARKLRELLLDGDLGRVFEIDAGFHNAYGPDKPWCSDPLLSGGGAFIDLGVHLVDLVLWLFDARACPEVKGMLLQNGVPLNGDLAVEDYADVELALDGAPRARIRTSFRAHVGRDCHFRVSLLGNEGGAVFRNVGGSFYDFELCLLRGRERRELAREGADALANATLEWAGRLQQSKRYDPEVERCIAVAEVVEKVYQRS